MNFNWWRKEMATNDPRQKSAEQDAIRQPLVELHGALLKLHKALLD
jgi:hypothetical protein